MMREGLEKGETLADYAVGKASLRLCWWYHSECGSCIRRGHSSPIDRPYHPVFPAMVRRHRIQRTSAYFEA